MKKVVVIGGGTGVFTVLSGLKTYPYELSAIVSMADSGGSTGVLREEFGILPPGDIRRVLVALSESDNKILSELFNYRFDEGSGLKGHSVGNILLTALERITGSFDKAVEAASEILNVKGSVIPVTLESTTLCAELEDGQIIKGETNIDVPKHNGDLRIKRLYLDPEVTANAVAVRAVEQADVVILGPGDVYTSVLPNVLAGGMKDALQNTSAKIIYIVNIMTKFGETTSFRASDFVKTMQEYIGIDVIDTVVVNTGQPSGDTLARYQQEKDQMVEVDSEALRDLSTEVIRKDVLRSGKFIRHDPEKLAECLSSVIDRTTS